MTQRTEKWDSLVLSRADFWIVWRCHGIPCYHFVFFRSNGKKNPCMRTIFVTVMVITSKIPFWKLLNISCKFSTITRYIDNGIWKTPCSWKFYRRGSTYVLILSCINMMKRKWAKVPWKLLAAQTSNTVLWRTLHQDILLIIVYFFFFETNLVFKFNLVLIE